MIFEFGPARIDVDVERTRRWYESVPTVSRCCCFDGGPIARDSPRPAITLGLCADIFWVLEKENTYSVYED